MSILTKIQWCDSTVNPIMGCGGCELFPKPTEVTKAVDGAVGNVIGKKFDSTRIFKALAVEAHGKIKNPLPGHKPAVNTTNIWHLRHGFADQVRRDHGKAAGAAAGEAIRKSITCYAATLHLNRGTNITEPGRKRSVGYAPLFESVTRFPGRAEDAAGWDDLLGLSNPKTPWKARLPRMIFVSDMGDALSAKRDFAFLKADLMPAIQSEGGKRHLWLWLTKQPGAMAEFAREVGGLPPNVCAMTTVTSLETLGRIDQLRKVNASTRGLSLEPLWERIPPNKINLKGIDWVIVGGESGSGKLTRPFALEWAEELRDHCRNQGVAFFLKQLGRNPSRGGKVFKLRDKHGGDWDEWDESLRVREFPKAFHKYRAGEMKPSKKPRPIVKKKPPKDADAELVSAGDKAAFKRLDKIVRKGVAAFMEAGTALLEIHERKLWKGGGFSSWESYCRSVAGMSKSHAHRLLQASRIALELAEPSPIGDALPLLQPVGESQLRPLHRLDDREQRKQAWRVAVEKAGGQPTALEVADVVCEILDPEAPQGNRPTRSQQRMDVLVRIKAVIKKRKSWEDVEGLLKELEELL